jgi:cell wall assembly regulator SMI1
LTFSAATQHFNMPKLTFERDAQCDRSATEAEVCRFEAKHDIVLPAEYRTFLLTHNGGRVLTDGTESYVPLAGHPHVQNLWIDQFFPLCEPAVEIQTLDAAIEEAIHDGIPKSHIPIAGGSDWFTIGLAPNNRGQVYFWDHEEKWETSDIIPWRVTNSLAEFFALIASFQYDSA